MEKYKTTFGIEVDVADSVHVKNVSDILDFINLCKNKKHDKHDKHDRQDEQNILDYKIVGGGSNLILSDKMSHKLIFTEILGKEIIENKNENSLDDRQDFINLRVGGGEVWDKVVDFAVTNELSGIEALSAIPGLVSGTPVQNIGAYGLEIKNVLQSVETVDLITGAYKIFTNKECDFSYRNSIFKRGDHKGKYFITYINLKLRKSKLNNIPKYKAVQDFFKNKYNLSDEDIMTRKVSIKEIREVITAIRWSKLPRPEALSNVGSFFHNPIISKEKLENLKMILSDLVYFEIDINSYKVPAGYLLESAGLKNYKFKNQNDMEVLATYEKNALVFVNFGGAIFIDLEKFITFIQNEIKMKYDIDLIVEPEIVC